VIILNNGLLSLHESLPPFGMDANTVIMVVSNLINVGILAAILAFLLYRPVRNVLHKRTERIRRQLQQAEDEMTRAMELRRQYELKMEEVEKERDEILTETRKQAADAGRRLLAEAKTEADMVRDRAAANVEMEWERAQTKMRTTIIDVSSVMAEKFVTLAINKDTHDKLLSEAMSDLEGMTWEN